MNRRWRWVTALIIAAPVALTACGSSSTQSGSKKLVLACYSAAIQAAIQKYIIPGFDKKYNASVTYLPGTSSASIAKIQAEKSHPQIDVACMDPGPQSQAVGLGLLQPTPATALSNLSQVYDVAKLAKSVGVAWALNGVGLAYNTKEFASHHLAPPTSWNDLENPKLKGHVIVPDIGSSSYAADLLVMLAKANGGSVNNIQPGFAAMKKIKSNVITFDTTGDLSSYFQLQDAWVGVWSEDETEQYIKGSHFPVKFAFPTEGTPSSSSTLSVVKNAPQATLADEFLNYMISPATQALGAKYLAQGPVNKKTMLDPAVARTVIYGQSSVDKLLQLDLPTITAKLPAWTSQWNQTIETGH